MKTKLILLIAYFVPFICAFDKEMEQYLARNYMKELERNMSLNCNDIMSASWNFQTDIENKQKQEEYNKESIKFQQLTARIAENISFFEYDEFTDANLYRKFRFEKNQGTGILEEKLLEELQAISSEMVSIYSTGTICTSEERNKEDCSKLELEPDIETILSKERDWDELNYVWEAWRNVTGKNMRKMYIRYIQLLNKAAKLDGYTDAGEQRIDPYTVDSKEVMFYSSGAAGSLAEITHDDFREMVDNTWKEVSESLYKKLHAFVRLKLAKHYGSRIDLKGPMPAHILGNMWAQSWENIAEFVRPFPQQPLFDITDSMRQNNWTIERMFKESENFFTSIGLYKMTDTFWKKSVFDKAKWGKSLTCHASASDFCEGQGGDDYRIKMCTDISMNDLITAHHEMGHIEYFMAYSNQSFYFRAGANPGFHEAIGDLIALSVATPDHMKDVLELSPKETNTATNGKPPNEDIMYTDEEQRDLNSLMTMALDKIAFLPFGYLMDKYRWAIFDGSITEHNLNEQWWKLRYEIQGVAPPAGPRGEEYFDAGAKFHVPGDVPYVRYFVSNILQFQFQKHLCSIAEYKGPLHKCDIYNNKKAGKLLKDALKLGFSKPWPLVLKDLGGSMEMDPSAITEYFKPLIDYLDSQLEGEFIGWQGSSASRNLMMKMSMFASIVLTFGIVLLV